MVRNMLLSKIHRATVTQTDLNYAGSITIAGDMLDETGMVEFEKVDVYDIDNGNRFQTYILRGESGSGSIGVNGAAARLVSRGDKVIIVNFGLLSEEEMKHHTPTVIVVESTDNLVRHPL